MRHTATKLFWALCGVVVMLALVVGIASVPMLAASNGIYIATATPHYKHPITGVIEDAGGDGSSVLGQSMTESATYKQALVEVDPDGNTYITVRLQLMDNIQNPQFQVDGKAVSASLMQEDYTNNTADYRMKVNSENSVIRCSMYVIAMGRDVVFYITVSNLQAGSGDFITSVKVIEPTPAPTLAPTQATTQATIQAPVSTETEASTPVATQTPAPTETSEPTTEEQETETTVTLEEETTVDETENTTEEKEDDKVVGLEEFDASGNKVEKTKEAGSDKTEDKDSNGSIIGWLIGGVVIVAAAGFAVWYFCFFKKKK